MKRNTLLLVIAFFFVIVGSAMAEEDISANVSEALSMKPYPQSDDSGVDASFGAGSVRLRGIGDFDPPEDPFPTEPTDDPLPIGDGFWFVLVMSLSYLGIRIKREKQINSNL